MRGFTCDLHAPLATQQCHSNKFAATGMFAGFSSAFDDLFNRGTAVDAAVQPEVVRYLRYYNASGDVVHCAFGCASGGEGLTYIARDIDSEKFGYLLDIPLTEALRKHYTTEGHDFSVKERKALDGKDEDDRIPSLKAHLAEKLTGQPPWWFSMDMPVPADGFRLAKISTSLSKYIPKMDLKFDMNRVREMEEGAHHARPGPRVEDARDIVYSLFERQLRKFIFVNSAGQARILGPIGALLEACSKNPGQWAPQVAGLPDSEQILDMSAGPYVIFAEGARTNGTGILRFPKAVDAFVEAARKSGRLGAVGIHYSSKNNCGHYSPSHTLPIPGALHTLYQMAQLYQPATVTWLPCKDTKASTAIQTTTLLSRLVGRECVDMSEKVDARTAEAFRNYYSQYSVVSKKAE
ncbi:hypothetical protein FOL46_005544 [Perkinsus olseni]|uniref:Uncharacterized protein n=1 Tax=Perkinsus olseni TaxID=32597 RepID=A0A7J6LRV0_PEROL|nr:hypothetical protein FOL46_005544 [Perkinsus olseni]